MVSHSLLRPVVVRWLGVLSAGEQERRANPRIL